MIAPELAVTLAAVVDEGGFESAARRLALTQSAVSQRIRALETSLGRPALTRARPPVPTEAGEAVLRYARQVTLLGQALDGELNRATEHPHLTLVVNADSLHTWALPGLASVAGVVRLEVIREDQAHSLDLLRSGSAAAAITSVEEPVRGCRVARLGVMRYRPVCSAAYAARHFSAGATADVLAHAPIVVFDRKDTLQHDFLARHARRRLDPPSHHVPASQEYADAIRLGLGWGLLPEQEAADELRSGALVTVRARAVVDVPLFWQQWRHSSPSSTWWPRPCAMLPQDSSGVSPRCSRDHAAPWCAPAASSPRPVASATPSTAWWGPVVAAAAPARAGSRRPTAHAPRRGCGAASDAWSPRPAPPRAGRAASR